MSDAKTAIDAIKKSLDTLPKTIPQMYQKDVSAYTDAAKAASAAVAASVDTSDTKRHRDLVATSQSQLTAAQAKLDLASKAVTAATKDVDEKTGNLRGAKAQLAENVKQQAKSLDTAKSKLTDVTQAAQRLSTVLKGKTQSPEKDILSAVTKGSTDIPRAVNSVDKPE